MRLQRNPNRWSCLPTAFAIALDVPVAEVIKRIGHDGSEVAFRGQREPNCRRGFHIQECIEVALSLGIAVTPVEAFPRHAPAFDVNPVVISFPQGNEARFRRTIEESRGVITGRGLYTQHAVAYGYRVIYDPGGFGLYLQDSKDDPGTFSAYCAWRFT
jgi:hypothetical protein